MTEALFFTVIGYLSGSLLFAKYFGRLFKKEDVTQSSPDQNPGTFNAFRYGGFWCGTFTLCADLLKGFLPVFLYKDGMTNSFDFGLSFVLAAPVLGHTFSVFHRFRGGKGIAVSFGCLIGLAPEIRPLCVLVVLFLLFSLLIKVSPHYYRTLLTYMLAVVIVFFVVRIPSVSAGFAMIAGAVIMKLFLSPEEKGKCKVDVLWKH